VTGHNGSRHDGYRERLAALATNRGPIEAIVEAGEACGLWPVDRRWVCAYGRFFPGREPFVNMVFETEGDPQYVCCVEGYTTRPATTNGSAYLAERPDGWLAVTPFPCDDRLPTLAKALARPGRRTVVRYRPRNRCTMRFQDHDGRVQFVKVFRDDEGERSHANGLLLWAATERRELGFTVARPGGWDAGTRTMWQEGIPGVPTTAQYLAAGGATLADRMGRAAASLPQSTVRPTLVYDRADHFRRSEAYASDLRERVPRLGAVLDTLLQAMREVDAAVEHHELRPIHGSLSRTQWVDDPTGLGLVDFDKLAFGDPEFDVAAFLTELDYDRIRVDQIRDAFVSGYEAVAGPLDRRLLHLYAAHERLEKAVKAARAVRPDGDERAAEHLETATAECANPTT